MTTGIAMVRSKMVGALALLSLALAAQAQDRGPADVLQHKERSTLESIRFVAMDAEDLSETAVEGALGAPAAGNVSKPVSQEVARLGSETSASFELRDVQTDLGRHEIPVDFRFEPPKTVPGMQFSNEYMIRPDSNRTYDTMNLTSTAR